MNLESQVVSLELAKRLKELGVKQDSLFLWEHHDDSCYGIKYKPFAVMPDFYNKFKLYSAFTVAELCELLPKEIASSNKYHPYELNIKWELHYSDNQQWHITYIKYDELDSLDYIIYDEKLADCCAKMLIHLLESGLIKNDT